MPVVHVMHHGAALAVLCTHGLMTLGHFSTMTVNLWPFGDRETENAHATDKGMMTI